jgi:ABC-2 type transport system ATP-binding protein
VVADRLGKVYGRTTHALHGLSLSVNQGDLFGVLGPRGSGKTTLLRILATILYADAGRACILGYDVENEGSQVRRRIGYLGQAGGLDPRLTCLEHARFAARLQGIGRRDAARGAERMLARFNLLPLADARVASLPLFARKRLALACAMVHQPRLLLVDEPVDDLSAEERSAMWGSLRALHREDQITILLATRHLDDADGLCRRVALIDGGKIIASGTPEDLKAQVPTIRITVRLAAFEQAAAAAAVLEHRAGVRAIFSQTEHLEVEVAGAGTAPMLLRFLEEHEIAVRDITISRPSLEEVFYRHTGRTTRDTQRRLSLGPSVTGRR